MSPFSGNVNKNRMRHEDERERATSSFLQAIASSSENSTGGVAAPGKKVHLEKMYCELRSARSRKHTGDRL